MLSLTSAKLPFGNNSPSAALGFLEDLVGLLWVCAFKIIVLDYYSSSNGERMLCHDLFYELQSTTVCCHQRRDMATPGFSIISLDVKKSNPGVAFLYSIFWAYVL